MISFKLFFEKALHGSPNKFDVFDISKAGNTAGVLS